MTGKDWDCLYLSFLFYSICRIRIHRQTCKQRNFNYTGAKHHMGKPDGDISDIPERKVCGGI